MVLAALLQLCPALAADRKNPPLPPLQALTPSLDQVAPQKELQGRIEDGYDPTVLSIPRSDSVSAYNAGLKLYQKGDFARALSAFQIALQSAERSFGAQDPRAQNARKAIASTAPHVSARRLLGYETAGKDIHDLKGTVTSVFPPSLAWLGGLKKGDLVTGAEKLRDGGYSLSIKRDGKLYSLNLRAGRKSEPQPSSSPMLSGSIKHPELLDQYRDRLASYDCALLIDCSGSMGDRIRIRNLSPDGRLLSRWNWCKQESLQLLSQGGSLFPYGITIVPFTRTFTVIGGARADRIARVFEDYTPDGGTNIAAPLAYMLSDYFKRKSSSRSTRPLAIAVLSDGEGNPDSLRHVIVSATQQMTSPREVVITFLGVDESEAGRPVIEALDNDLVSSGARFDIVDSRTFSELRQYGLLKMLVAALIEKQVE
ncbi:MAG: hypothetical protein KC777_09020 [Cyanobacteria bacterium HKST-UBA02]|nr:hypothetical protein [Cyanobacteria bacterium HKST-UBA02]